MPSMADWEGKPTGPQPPRAPSTIGVSLSSGAAGDTIPAPPTPLVSPDGRYLWDGTEWKPIQQTALVRTGEEAEYSARFFLSPVRVGLLAVVCGQVYAIWWLWRLFHHVKHEGLPRPHSFWTLLVPLYNLKTLSDQFRTVHEEAARAVGRTQFPLQAVYLFWLGGIITARIAASTTGLAGAIWLVVSAAMWGLPAYWVQNAANKYLAIRLPGLPRRGPSVGEIVAIVVGGFLTLLVIAASLLPT